MLHLVAGLIVGLALLAWSADVFVDNAARLARRCGLSPFVVGMFVIGFGTSLPEMMVSFLSALQGNPSIALGNAYGSNIANILLILGVTAVLRPLAVADDARRRDIPLLFSITLLAGALIANGAVSRGDALLMLAFFAAICARKAFDGKAKAADDDAPAPEPARPLWRLLLGVAVGLAAVVGSSRLLVVSAVGLARALGVPDLIVGLTVVAIGTSLPELASSIAAISRREHDLALGNIVGSNFFNTLAVVGIAGAVRPIDGEEGAAVIGAVLRRDWPAMALATLLLLAFCQRGRGRPASLGRWKGALFLILYLAYIAVLSREVMA